MSLKINSDIIIDRNVINLGISQQKMIRNGWGEDVLENTSTEVIYYENDGHKIKGYLSYPKDLKEKYPLIIWNRGGSRKSGMIDEFLACGMFGEIANWGYIVLASMYRDEDEFAGRDVDDILKLFDIADNIENCDSKLIGMEGWSRGGLMTFHILTKTNRVNCAVIISGLTDITNHTLMEKVYFDIFGSEDKNEFMKRKIQRSPLYFAENIDANVDMLLIHGTNDEQVPHTNSLEMYEKLKDRMRNIELVLYENGDHYLKKFRKETSELRKNWFNKYLKNTIV